MIRKKNMRLVTCTVVNVFESGLGQYIALALSPISFLPLTYLPGRVHVAGQQ